MQTTISSESKQVVIGPGEPVVMIGERINPTGRKKLAAGLEAYEDKALANSVNGEEAKLKEILPLVAQHKAAAVALTMDDNGIPTDVPTRLAIADKIINEAARLGIAPEDIVIDPLAMSVAADDQAGLAALQALQQIRSRTWPILTPLKRQ